MKNTYTAEAQTQRTIPTMATSLGRTVTGGKPLGRKFKANLESRTRKINKNAVQTLKLNLSTKTKVCKGISDLFALLYFLKVGCALVSIMEFSSRGYKIRKIFA